MNILDYLKKHKDEDFKATPFNEVDALILSLLPYLDFRDIVPAFKGRRKSLKDAYAEILQKKPKHRGIFISNTYKMLDIMQNSKRYQNALLYQYMYVVNDEMQFGALTIKLPDKSTFIAFAGTDSSIVGWEEDFKMAYLYPGASQKYASVYLNQAIKLFDRNVRIGGHSKGGNLAISSSMNAKYFIKKKIKQIYNFDGPGFLKEQVESKEYQSISKKIKMYVPEESIIGMILYHTDNYVVVKAKKFNILQHDAFCWMLNDKHFISSTLNKRSKNLEKKLTKKLEELSIPERLKLVQDIFNLFKKNNIKDTKEIKLKSIIHLIKSFQELDKETKSWFMEFLILLFLK